MPFPIKPPLPPMEARSVDQLPVGSEWQYEPKWDGFRCIAFRDGSDVYLQSKAGQPLARYFPDVVEAIKKLPARKFRIRRRAGHSIRGRLVFDELQLRLHPAASRVNKLAAAHPALFIVFDLVAEQSRSYLKDPLGERRKGLEKFAERILNPKGAFVSRRLVPI